MKKIFYLHWIFCISYLFYISYFQPIGFGRTAVILGFGSAFILGLSTIMAGYFNADKSDRIFNLYYQGNLISFFARSCFEMALFIYGTSLTDKWIVICGFSLIMMCYFGTDKLAKK